MWQPIDTAPRNGDEVLLYREDAGIFLARFTCLYDFLSEREIENGNYSEDDLHEAAWFHADFVQGDRLNEPATHWMPLPAPPANIT